MTTETVVILLLIGLGLSGGTFAVSLVRGGRWTQFWGMTGMGFILALWGIS